MQIREKLVTFHWIKNLWFTNYFFNVIIVKVIKALKICMAGSEHREFILETLWNYYSYYIFAVLQKLKIFL